MYLPRRAIAADQAHLIKIFERLIDPYPDTPASVPASGFLSFLWSNTQGVRRYLAAMTAFSALIAAFEAALYGLLGRSVDILTAFPSNQLWSRGRWVLLAIAAALATSVGLVAMRTLIKRQALATNFPMRLRWNFHRLILHQSVAFYQDEFAGRLAAKVMQTALALRDFWFTITDMAVYALIYVITIGLVAGCFHPWLLCPLFVWLILSVAAIVSFVPRLGTAGKAQADARSLMTGRISDAYTNISTVKLFSHASREAGFARQAMREFANTVYRQMRLISGFEVVNHAIGMLLVISLTGTALYLWSKGALRVGAVAAAGALAIRLHGLANWAMWEMTALFENIGTIQDGINTLTQPQVVLDKPTARPLHISFGSVRFESVSFAYQRREQRVLPIIDDLSLDIRPGEKIGLVGRSGAGKSTLVNLLLRFYDVQTGRILVDGVDISDVTQESLRAQIGMVTQDTSLLHRSIRDNILYGRPDASESDLLRAAEDAQAAGFIRDLVDARGRRGYDAHVGERGVKLSGGQRQRIALARVMLKDAPILLLDEATSALDSEVETVIQSGLTRLMRKKTVIAIAHRLSTIAAMDRLVVLDQGRIIETGDHATLLSRNGVYARLWSHQSGGFIGDEA